MRILVTGGAGFLGSHLCEKLLEQEHEVIALDNLYTGSKENIAQLVKNSGFEFIRHDVINPLSLEVDAIYNLACPASPIHYQKFPVQTIKTSLMGAINVLDLARKLEIPVLQASTSEVYGDPTISPQSESYWGNVNPIGLRSCYDEGKRAAESLFFDYHRQHNVNTKIVRIFNTYGPRMNLADGRVVSNFIVQALQGAPISIYGDGNQTRSFCYVDDLIDGLILSMTKLEPKEAPVNLGNEEEYSIIEIAQKIIQLTNSNSVIVFEQLPSDDPKQRKPDTKKAFEKLGWNATTSLENGLRKTIQDFELRLRSRRN
jgi:UDP-glucuronate decarboxylase